MELETHFMIAARLAYFKMGELQQVLTLTGDAGRTLAGFTKSLKSTVASNPVLDT